MIEERGALWPVADLSVVWIGQAHLIHRRDADLTLCGSRGGSPDVPRRNWVDTLYRLRVLPQCTTCHRVAFQHGVLWQSYFGSLSLHAAKFVGSNRRASYDRKPRSA